MEKKTLNNLLDEKLYQIPDYQRGYAWEKIQWNHFIQDLDALVDQEVKNHYTGTIVIYQNKQKPLENYGTTDKLELVDVVDGQQRLTTSCLYLSVIINTLISNGLDDYKSKIPTFLFSGNTCKLTLNNDSKDIFHDLIDKGLTNVNPETPHQKRLCEAYNHFQTHIESQKEIKNDKFLDYLKNLYDALVRKLNFTYYTIEEECEIGMTFELMNSRGKGLSILELLKNYLFYWISRNEKIEKNRNDLTTSINKNWKEIYLNIGKCEGIEDQCLRTAWTIYCTHTPKNWKGYEGFKDNAYIPLRPLSKERIDETRKFIETFSDGLALFSKHYAVIMKPTKENTFSKGEYKWLIKIHNTGNIANFLPLLIVSRIKKEENTISDDNYLDILKALECFAYRVFLYEGKRSNSGMSSLYLFGFDVFKNPSKIENVTRRIYSLIIHYSKEVTFEKVLSNPTDWYSNRRLLKYTLFEYELYLLSSEGKDKKPKLEWSDLSDSTIEHILPQNPDEYSKWKKDWSDENIKIYLHDIGNLVLTENNSNYRNFDFERKKGIAGEGICYANSDIRQERKIASYEKWNVDSVTQRRNEIINWIKKRWGIIYEDFILPDDINEDDNENE